jgi:hypothetical protein
MMHAPHIQSDYYSVQVPQAVNFYRNSRLAANAPDLNGGCRHIDISRE